MGRRKILCKFSNFRSDRRRCSLKKEVLKNLAKHTGKHLFWTLYFNKIIGNLYKLINSCKRLFLQFRQVAALSNAINCNVQPVYPVISNTLLKREHLNQILRWHTTSIEIITIMWSHINKQSTIKLVLKSISSVYW